MEHGLANPGGRKEDCRSVARSVRLRVPSLPEYGSMLDRIQGIRWIPQQNLYQRYSRPRIGVRYGQGSALTTVVFLLGDGRRTRSRCD
jgi:hypothetical protein